MPLYPSFFVDSAAAAAGYQIEQSLRFNDDDSSYLQLNGGTSPTDGKIFTHSVWVKRSEISGNDNNVFGSAPTSTLYNDIKFDNNDRLYYRQYHSSGGGLLWTLTTSARYRDPSAWLHIVVAVDTTQATSSNRVKMYVNGAQITQFDSESYPGQNQVPLGQNGNYAVGIGRLTTTFTNYFDGYMAEYHHVDGTAHDPTDFGEYDANGVWRPIEVTGITYGNRGWYLTFDPTATNGIGHDHSGNGNHFTGNNFTTSGTGTDVMSDTPTTNWCTLNPLDANGGIFFNGNLEYAGLYSSFSSQSGHGCRSTIRVPSSGKWYVEAANVTYSGSGNSCMLGFTSSKQAFTATAFGGNLTPWIGVDASVFNNSVRFYSSGVSGGTTSGTTLHTSYASNDTISFAIDFDDGKLWIGKNGSYPGNPSGGTNPTSTFTPGDGSWAFWAEYVAASDNSNRSQANVNFGQRAFAYTPPTNFLPLNTANLPAPDIADGSDYFNTVLYTGNGSTQSITGVGFQPDWVWMKSRTEGTANYTGHNVVQDAVRGTGTNTALVTNENYSESGVGYSDALTAFNSDGFSLGARNQVNYNGDSFVAWNWLAGGSVSSNTDGSITSTVSANPSAGFSIVSYTGTLSSTPGTAPTVGHGLNAPPDLIISKSLNSAGGDSGAWFVNHGYNFSQYLQLNSTVSQISIAAQNGGTPVSPTSTVFSTYYIVGSNVTGNNYVAYCFAEVEGYSKFGSYTGNGSTDGPFVHCGFKIRFLLLKKSTTGVANGNWYLLDATRNEYNPADKYILPNSSVAEGTTTAYVDFLSNGFKVRNTNTDYNESGQTYIFAAFAEHPTGGSGVSPATAR